MSSLQRFVLRGFEVAKAAVVFVPEGHFWRRKMAKSKVVLALGLLVSVPCVSRAALLTYFDFNNYSPAYNGSTNPGTLGSLNTTAATYGEAYSQTSNSTAGTLGGNTAYGTVFSGSAIKIDFSNIATATNGTNYAVINGKTGSAYTAQGTTGSNSGYGLFLDSTLNRASGDTSAGGSLLLLNNSSGGTSSLNNKYLTFSLSSTGYKDLSLTYAARVTNNVTASQAWSYSTDGTSFTNLSTIAPSANGTFATQTLNLAAITALNDKSAFYLRMTYTTANAGGSQAFDNIQLTGTAIPEPAAIGSICGVLATAGLRRKRR